eukprot:TRINITY_DN6337_c0_g1_i2.p2 TRINITY_DN6337_c0_g1~~TRINITY_DN6337_c0_g1_i2.p2  ORF type:complete len:109 (+),score=8.63 TRINITY_DN6337_c0_g1_i2:412-738(+)
MATYNQARLFRLDLHFTGLAVKVIVGENRFLRHNFLNLGYGNFGLCQYFQVWAYHHALAKLLGQVTYDIAIVCQLLGVVGINDQLRTCLLYTSPSPRDQRGSRMPSSA